MNPIRVSGLFIHPLKSAKPISLEAMDIVSTGPRWDREWMLIDRKSQFVSQRKHAKMCLIDQQITTDSLVLNAPGMKSLKIPLQQQEASLTSFEIFGRSAKGIHLEPGYDQWFSQFLSDDVRLVRMPSTNRRLASQKYVDKETEITFADGFPFLMTSESTLDELNEKLPTPITMTHFRPNIVIKGAVANQEDQWSHFSIGELGFQAVKACSRCSIITVDPKTGQSNNQVMTTLMSYRKQNDKVVFGQNLVHEQTGRIRVGDPISIL